MSTVCQVECRKKYVGFADCSVDHFCQSQWGNNRNAYLAYRILMCLVPLSILVAHWVFMEQNYPFYMTNWVEIFINIYFIFALSTAVYEKFTTRENKIDHSQLMWVHKTTWVIFNVAFDTAFLVDILFWALLSSRLPLSFIHHPFNIYIHALNLVLLIIDLFVGDLQIRLLHVFYPIIAGFLYSIFTLVLHFAGVTSSIYKNGVIDWEHDPAKAALILFLAGVIFVCISHLFLFGLFKLRRCIATKCGCLNIEDKAIRGQLDEIKLTRVSVSS